MTTIVFVAVMGAALLHAMWNALVKSGGDKDCSMTAVVVGHVPFGLAAIMVSPGPHTSSLPYIFAAIALHVGYQFFLLASYRIGDLTQVYPIARGIAPLIVAVVSVVFLGVHLGTVEQLAILVIGAGIMSLGLVRQGDGMRNSRATFFALGTGCFIAGYSLIDGIGARIAGTALGFYGWMTLGNALAFSLLIAPRKPQVLRFVVAEGKWVALLGGTGSSIAYALVIWSFTQAPIALVTALRETSIIFALLIGVFFLKERIDITKVFSTLVTIVGVVLLRTSR